jgi:hypothetical protein
MVGDEMHDLALALDSALHRDHASNKYDEALAFVQRGPDHQVGDAGFIGLRPRLNTSPQDACSRLRIAAPAYFPMKEGWRFSTKAASASR